jgi:hypothetical protein
MERTMRWRAEPTRSSRVHRRNRGGRGLRAAAAAGAMVAVTMPVLSADGAVGVGRSIEVFTSTDMIGLAGYPANTNVRVEVVRHGFVVGYATRMTDSLGGILLNHVGGAAGDCFDSPTAPDVQPSDTIRTTVLKAGGGVDTSSVRGVWLDEVRIVDDTTMQVSGHVALGDQPGAVNPATDVLELRINKDVAWDVNDKPGNKDRRELIVPEEVQPNGTFTHVLTASAQDIIEVRDDSETFLEWSDATGTELTIAEAEAPEPLLGCPPPASGPTAPLLLAADDTGKVGDHVTSKTTDLTFSGLAGTGVTGAPGPGQSVTLLVDGRPRAEVTADADGVYQFTGVSLSSRAAPHTVRVISLGRDAQRLVTVDARAPGVRLRTFDLAPLQLAGSQRFRAVYAISEGATIEARINHLGPTFPVKVFDRRTTRVATTSEFVWNGKNVSGFDVRPGRYQLVLRVTDKAGNSTLHSDTFRVTR